MQSLLLHMTALLPSIHITGVPVLTSFEYKGHGHSNERDGVLPPACAGLVPQALHELLLLADTAKQQEGGTSSSAGLIQPVQQQETGQLHASSRLVSYTAASRQAAAGAEQAHQAGALSAAPAAQGVTLHQRLHADSSVPPGAASAAEQQVSTGIPAAVGVVSAEELQAINKVMQQVRSACGPSP